MSTLKRINTYLKFGRVQVNTNSHCGIKALGLLPTWSQALGPIY